MGWPALGYPQAKTTTWKRALVLGSQKDFPMKISPFFFPKITDLVFTLALKIKTFYWYVYRGVITRRKINFANGIGMVVRSTSEFYD
jgi:hypothetical protein